VAGFPKGQYRPERSRA